MSDDGLDRARDASRKAMHGVKRNYDELDQDKFEDEVVKFLLRKFGLQGWKWPLLNKSRDEAGVSKFRLAYFNQIFDAFPVILACRRIKKLSANMNVRGLFADFSNMAFVQVYEEFYNDVRRLSQQDHKAVGLIFKWPYLPGGLVVHNLNIELDRTGTRMIRVLEREGESTLRLVLEDLTSFCNMLDGRWKIPEE